MSTPDTAPKKPSVGVTYYFDGMAWKWNGATYYVVGSSPPPAALPALPVVSTHTSVAQTLATSGPVNFDASLGKYLTCTLSANGAAGTVSNLSVGQEIIVSFIQDATGSRTYAWPSSPAIKFTGGSAPAASTAPNARDLVGFYYEGTNLRELFRSLNQ